MVEKLNSQTIMSKLIICIYILNGFFFNTLSVESANRFPSFLNLYRSLNERKIIISSITSSGKSNKDLCFKHAMFDLPVIMSDETRNLLNIMNKKATSSLSHKNFSLQLKQLNIHT